MSDLAEIAVLYDPEEAHVACGFLQANGIDAVLGDAETLSTLPLHRIALGGFRIIAPANQAHAARILLSKVEDENKPRGYDIDGIRCRLCGSDRFTRIKPWFLPSILLFLFGAPIWWNSRRLRCSRCGAIEEINAAETVQ